MTGRKRAAALDAALAAMFRTLEARGVPEHLRAVVDQLDGEKAPAPRPPAQARLVRPSPRP